MIGRGLLLPVWTNVIFSKPSSKVPKPPGKSTVASDSLRKNNFLLKKYLKLIAFSSPIMYGLCFCSKGSFIFKLKLFSRPAPLLPASIIPGPPPVITLKPFSTISLDSISAILYSSESLRTRAEPKTTTFFSSLYEVNIFDA